MKIIRAFLLSPLFLAGLVTGYQLYTMGWLLPAALKELELGKSPDLLLLGTFILLATTQLELGRRLTRLAAAMALRDSLVFAGIGYFIFSNTLVPFWITLAFLGWCLSLSALQISAIRLALIAAEGAENRLEARRFLVGLLAGLVAAKLPNYFGGDAAWQINLGIALALVVIFRVHLYCRVHGGYPSPTVIWLFRELASDPRTLGLLAVSAATGLIVGLMVVESVYLGPAIIGAFLALVFFNSAFNRFGRERAVRWALAIAAVALVFDGLMYDRPAVIAPAFLALAAAGVYAAVAVNGFAPEILIPLTERAAIFNLGQLGGFILAGALSLPGVEPEQRYWAVSFLLMATAFFTSFGPTERVPPLES